MHEQLDEYERWRLLDFQEYEPLMVRPDARGRISPVQRVRASVSTFFFEDRIAPVRRSELEASHHDGIESADHGSQRELH